MLIEKQCSNERPFCQKCIASGRECEGYERERVFITGTPESKGRVASHPKKGPSSSKQKTLAGEGSPKPDLAPLQPFTSAWDDHTLISSQGIEYSVLVSALRTKLPNLLRESTTQDESEGFRISLPSYAPSELTPALVDQELRVSAQCLARLPSLDEGDDSAESYCVFLFEHDLLVGPTESGPDQMRRFGPAHFSQFPNHHFFVRVYRPLVAGSALLSRRDTFLSTPEWRTDPWQNHPKSSLDHLLDLILFLPSILAHTDQIVPLEATLNRRGQAQGLLEHCLSLELTYWAEELTSPGGLIPFSNSYTFKDSHTGLAFLYYWMAQIPFHRCIEGLHRVIFQPVIDAYPNMWPDLPPDLQIEVSRYQHGREFAADICRGLDSVLDSTVQPDVVVAPMVAALDFYKEINSTSQDGLTEMMWLDSFRARVTEKGQHVASVLEQQEWIEVAVF
ncbi:hypothetical protein AK830_g5032 [Neonectria ditissima]|uniref:Zn(2)-C6 fungal-type domain-containing protein n=1 Tax=Neonectria ditissima TaxID=78410 RepID=A0A0P7B587_9HYPO|nr:hypothetical protein AK830_g5032 [Neonectria ditissima]